MTFTLHSGREAVRLALEPNVDIIPEGLKVTLLDSDGSVSHSQNVQVGDHKVYRGSSFVKATDHDGWVLAGWARVFVRRDGDLPVFDGAFTINGDTHHIELGPNYQRVKHHEDPKIETTADTMVVWRDSDVRSEEQVELKRSERGSRGSSFCAADQSDFNINYDMASRNFTPLQAIDPQRLFGRQSIDGGSNSGDLGAGDLSATIGDTSGCPTSRKVARVGVATDCNYWQEFSKDSQSDEATRQAITQHIISTLNRASQPFENDLKISLALGDLTIQPKECPASGSASAPWNIGCSGATLNDRLSLFSKWRGEKTDSFAYWSLFTTCPTLPAVGFAWRGQLCQKGSNPNGGNTNETIAGANVIVKGPTEWQIFAHESGHTFGAVHDCVPDTCPGGPDAQPCCPFTKNKCDASGQFLMNPASNSSLTQFSQCTIGNICSGLKGNVKSDCLTDNKNIQTFSASQECGNGIVEPGEECDCGGEAGCKNNPCCGADCKFTKGSICDPGNEDCCTKECKFASSDKVCRPSTGPCDPQETCSGKNATCPPDQHKQNGDSCGDGLECASGTCTSRDKQCQVYLSGQPGGAQATSCGNDCFIQCQASSVANGQCFYSKSYLIDGTSCAGGGRCTSGRCEGGNWWKTFTDWYQSHLAISVPVTIIVGILILVILSSCFCRCFGRKRSPVFRKMATPPQSSFVSNGNGGWQSQQRHWGSDASMSGAHGPGNNMAHSNYPMQDLNPGQQFHNQGHMYPPPPPPPPYGNSSRTATRYA